MVRKIHSERIIKIPKGVEVWIKSRKVRVKGPRGELRKDFNHLDCDMRMIDGGRSLKLEVWFGRTKALACMRTVTSHVQNMITGVTKVRQTNKQTNKQAPLLDDHQGGAISKASPSA
eukprot:TRINITY_DN8_c0_g2_i1.p1 TRINITY_DN8_c0_g2~~TRINITY_DN8_c0_g2_i1.p1  ORF type:complete len:128 (-),score=31.19 TRINITY_DN8_c0_g2_i1:131-481(-)